MSFCRGRRTADQGCDTAEHPNTIVSCPFCGDCQAYRQSGIEARLCATGGRLVARSRTDRLLAELPAEYHRWTGGSRVLQILRAFGEYMRESADQTGVAVCGADCRQDAGSGTSKRGRASRAAQRLSCRVCGGR